LEKLVIDNEICGMALRIVKGVELREGFSKDLYGDIYNGEHFLTSPHTVEWLREEFYFPSDVISRENYQVWESTVGKSAGEKAHDKVNNILHEKQDDLLDNAIVEELKKIMLSDAKKYGVDKLP